MKNGIHPHGRKFKTWVFCHGLKIYLGLVPTINEAETRQKLYKEYFGIVTKKGRPKKQTS